MPERYQIKVVCDQQSHSPKVAIVGRISVEVDRRGQMLIIGLDDELEGSTLLDRGKLYGSPATAPDGSYNEEHPRAHRRSRGTFQCPLCGLNVPIRQENAMRLAEGLRHADDKTVRLGHLAAIVS